MTTRTLTPHQKKLLTLLRQSAKPLTAYALLDKLHDSGFRAPPTIYRALEALEKLGLVHKIESLNAFVACCHADEEKAHSSAFVLCTSCGAAKELDGFPSPRALAKAADGFLTDIRGSILEISGLCKSCARKATKES